MKGISDYVALVEKTNPIISLSPSYGRLVPKVVIANVFPL